MWRLGADVRLSADDRHVADLRRALALHGVATVPEDVPLPPAPTLVRAIGVTLDPVRLAGRELDVIDVRLLPLAEATTSELHRPIPRWPVGERRRARCRTLLRGDDTVLEIRRTAWCGTVTLRSLRRVLRPVLFEPTASAPVLRRYASQHELSRWVGW